MRLERIATIALLGIALATITLAAVLGHAYYSWSPCKGALSDLGVYPATRPVFNSGVALAALALTLYSARRPGWLAAAVPLALVATITEDYGAPHFLVAAAFFTAPLALLPGESKGAAITYTCAYTALVYTAFTRNCLAVAEYAASLVLAVHVARETLTQRPRRPG